MDVIFFFQVSTQGNFYIMILHQSFSGLKMSSPIWVMIEMIERCKTSYDSMNDL